MPMTAPMGEVPLCGRIQEHGALQEHLLAAIEGRGQALILTGEPGMGKTRLIRELVRSARRLGCLVLAGQGSRLELDLPYAIWADAVHPYLRGLAAEELSAVVGWAAPLLEPVFPALAGLLPPDVFQGQVGGGLDAQGPNRRRVLESVFQFLRRLSARAPLVLVLDDLHWADAASLELFAYVARNLADSPFLLVAAARSGGGAGVATFTETVQELGRGGRLAMIELGPLPASAGRDLLKALLPPEAAGDGGLEHLLERASGNPLFLEELARARLQGRVQGLPATVRDVVRTRLAALEPVDRELLEWCAVLAMRPTLGLLAALSGRPEPQVLAALEAACRARLLVEKADRDGVTWSFAHPLLAEALDEDLGAVRRLLLHGRAAQTLEMQYWEGRRDLLEVVANHYRRADPSLYREITRRYLVLAGERCLRRHAPEEAVRWLESARDLVETETSLQERSQILLNLGLAYLLVSRTSLAEQHLSAVAADPGVRPALRGRACRLVGATLWWLARHAEALEWWQRGIQILAGCAGDSEAETERVRLLQVQCQHQVRLGQVEAGRLAGQQALDIAGRLQDPHLVAQSHAVLVLAYAYTTEAEVGLAHSQQALAAAGGQRYTMFWALFPVAMLHLLRGEMRAAAAGMEPCLELAEQLQSPDLRGLARAGQCMLLTQSGQWAGARQAALEAEELLRRLGLPAQLPRNYAVLARADALAGDLTAAEAAAAEARRSLAGVHADSLSEIPALVALASCHALTGDWQQARADALRAVSRARDAGFMEWMYWALPSAAEAAVQLGDPAAAAEVDELLAAGPERGRATAWGVFLAGQLAREPAAACRHLTEAARQFRSLELPHETGRAVLALARALLEAGDENGAVEQARVALEDFDRLGARRDADAARALLRSLGAAAASVRRTTAGALSERETEVLALVARGLTNREIGQELFISRRTVDAHVQNLLRKLDVSGRAELVAVAAARGLYNAQR